MQEGLQDFLRKFESARPPNTPHVDAPTASTPYGAPARMRPDFEFQSSPVVQEDARQAIHSTLPHIRSARTVDHEDIRETRIDPACSTLPHIASARTGDYEDIRETRIDPARSTLPHIASARTGDHEDIRESRNTLPHIRCARTHRGTQRISGRAHPGSGRLSRTRRLQGHAHPGTRRFQGHAHPRTQRRQRGVQPRTTISTQRMTHTRGRQREQRKHTTEFISPWQ